MKVIVLMKVIAKESMWRGAWMGRCANNIPFPIQSTRQGWRCPTWVCGPLSNYTQNDLSQFRAIGLNRTFKCLIGWLNASDIFNFCSELSAYRSSCPVHDLGWLLQPPFTKSVYYLPALARSKTAGIQFSRSICVSLTDMSDTCLHRTYRNRRTMRGGT